MKHLDMLGAMRESLALFDVLFKTIGIDRYKRLSKYYPFTVLICLISRMMLLHATS